MRKFFLSSLVVLLPQLTQAQIILDSFKPGYYQLSDNRLSVYKGKLKVRLDELITKDEQGNVKRFKPEEVYYVKTASSKRYMPASGFPLPATTLFQGDKTAKPTLVELLDSGQVKLMRYATIVAGAPMMNAGGGMSYSGSSTKAVYLLQRADESEPVSLPSAGISGNGQKFLDALMPYVKSRPDLTLLLIKKRVSVKHLADFIHALNTGQPFAPTTASNF
ncbi:hypothetical protein [Hymenobacter cavernae]|uniref:YkuD domain-containing protein n=1 Tax=Hymenobacter cavernae TaxID=2044852 RepID=A0ABQ1UR05_9BACT|nr:hypothetical protein [Hymenobacter cavernae]GGF24965.1 hypothetical protein GCM10011383_40670 [Hymenobacter cavernae]